MDTGRIYTPATRTWRETPPLGQGGWENLGAVWTGSEMIVWGGRSGNYITNTGGRYNPASNSWTPTSLANAPQARSYHIAVWTGSEMIVWGGNGDIPRMNTGGRYDPATDSWTPTSLTNAPEGRYLFDAVWDGDELIVWGGIGNSGELNSGGRYAPTTNSWQPTSLANAPVARHWHSAVWTGEEMIVWGGVDFPTESNFSSGGRYDPDSDSWQPTSTANAPEARARHTALWTGAEMIVWGGCTGLYCGSSGTEFYTGGHYNPLSDTWTPTAIDRGVPRGRGEHTAVWTGSAMIVWGGYTDQSTFTNTGAEYYLSGVPPIPLPTATPTGSAATITPLPTHTATSVPPTATPQSGTPTATGVPPTTTPTAIPPVTPTATDIPATVTASPTIAVPTATGVPATPTASPTEFPTTATPGNLPGDLRLFLPLIRS